ncbi:hypothetical protein ACTS9D_07045 [Empedobacter brevis]
MRKIEYSDIESLKTKYYNSVADRAKEKLINVYLECFNKHNNLDLNYKKLLTSNFEDLIRINEQLLFWSKNYDIIIDDKSINEFNDLFDYKNKQEKISDFFMTNFDFKICHYCDEQYISSFVDVNNDYLDYLDFLNTASFNELILLKNIKYAKADVILEFRKNTIINNSSKITGINLENLKEAFENLKCNKTHNYFTLDHVLPQKKFPFFSLSLFNFVPSCFSCNTKFKGSKEFNIDKILYSSPTSSIFDIDKRLKFKMLIDTEDFDIDELTLNDLLKNLQLKINAKEEYSKEFLSMFKLSGRYINYKEDMSKLISKRIKYPDSMIEQISKTVGQTENEIKKAIFGEELFEINSKQPLSKLKKDISEQLKLF